MHKKIVILTLCSWLLAGSAPLRNVTLHNASLNTVTHVKDIQQIIAAYLALHDHLAHALESHTQRINSILICPNGQYIISASADSTVKLWQTHTGVEIESLTCISPISQLAFSADGAQLAALADDKTVYVFDTRDLNEMNTRDGIHARDFSQINGDINSLKSLYSKTTDRQVTALIPVHNLKSAASAQNNAQFATISRLSPVKINALKTGKLLRKLETDKIATHITLSPDTRYMTTGPYYQQLKIWDLKTGKLAHTLKTYFLHIYALVFAPTKTRFALSGSANKRVEIWSKASQRLVHQLPVETDILALSYNTDGSILAGGGKNGMIKFWDTQTGQLIHNMHAHTGPISSLIYSPDGNYLISASHDKTIKIWKKQNL